MNPFTHADTIQASNATAEAFNDRPHLPLTRTSFIEADAIGGSYVSPDDSLSTISPKENIMTNMHTGTIFDEVYDTEILGGDEAHEVSVEATSIAESEGELALVGRPVVEFSSPETVEAEDALASRAAKRIKNAEKLADETGEVRIGDEVEELSDRTYATIDALAGFHASDDVLETIENETNFGLTVLDKADADSFLTLTMGDSSCLELTLRNANGWKLLAFAKRLHDFSSYDLKAHPEMQFVADSLTSTGRLLDSQGFEAIVWEDIHNSAFIRHCVNVAQALKFDLYFDKRAQKQCNRLTVKRAPGVTNKVIIAGSLNPDKTPEVVLEAAVRLTGVYAYEAPIAAPSEAKIEVKAVAVVQPVKVAPSVAAKPANQVKAVKKARPAKTDTVVKLVEQADGTRFTAGDEVTTKVVRFAKFGVIVQDALGNEGFLGFREKDAAKKGGVDHDRLVVKVGDEIKVKVVSVGENGFAKVTLLFVVDPSSHYLSCLPVDDVQLGVVMRRRSEHCFYVLLGGPIDGILAVRDIPNLSEVKDKLRADTRLTVRITSVNPEKRNFHVVIESFGGSTN
jgi:hypothetical protein